MIVAQGFDSINSIAWVQFRLLGGWRKIGLACVIYLAVFFVVASLAWQVFQPGNVGLFCNRALLVVGIVQVAVLVMAGSGAVHRAVRRDHQTRMMESHRLSPITGAEAVAGYLLGPTGQVLAVFVLGTILGVVLCAAAGVQIAYWLLAMGYLLVAAAMMASLSLLYAMAVERGGNPLPWIIALGSTGGFWLVPALPGLCLMLGVNVATYAYRQVLGTGTTGLPEHFALTLAAEIMMTLTWLLAAIRKFRWPERPAFGVASGYVLLAQTLLLSVLGLWMIEEFRAGPDWDTSADVSFCASVLLSLLAAVVPIYAAEFTRRHGRLDRRTPAFWERPASVVVAAAGLLILCWYLADGAWTHRGLPASYRGLLEADARRWQIMTAVILLWLAGTAGLCRLMVALRVQRRLTAVVLWTLFSWGLPPFVDQLRQYVINLTTEGPIGWSIVLGMSVPGTMVVLWRELDVSIWPGLVVQVAVAAVMLSCGIRVDRNRFRRAPSPGRQ